MRASAATALTALALTSTAVAAPLLPLAWTPLPHGSVEPEGWLRRQLEIQSEGLSGHFPAFWPPVNQSAWVGGNDAEEDWFEIWPYVIQGYFPQAILLRDPAQLAQCETWVNHLLAVQAAYGTGWMGIPLEKRDAGMTYWPQWPVILSLLAWREWGVVVNGTEDARLMPAILANLHNASALLVERPMGYDWSGTRWQDFVFTVQAVMDAPSCPPGELPFLAALAATAYEQGRTHGIDWAAYYAGDHFPHDAVPNWDYLPHGVNNAMAGKGGAVTWRQGLDPAGNVSSWTRDRVLMQYHGAPSGNFLADECLAGTMPSKGAETCLVVEQMFSLNIVHEVQGDAHWAERAETIAYNAMPAVGTKDMWTRVYLQQPNEVFAGSIDPHPFNSDGPDSLVYSLAGNYMCCTANFNQGFPRFVQHMLHASPDGGVAVSSLGPVSASLAGGVRVNVSTDYPFDDDITVTLSGLPVGAVTYPLYIRVPSWATNATLAVNGRAPSAVGGSAGTMLRVAWGGGDVGPVATVVLGTNPAVRVEPAYNGTAISVHRGALLYALQLEETFVQTDAFPTEPRAVNWVVEQPGCDAPNKQPCGGAWNVALVVANTSAPGDSFTFSRIGGVPAYPFAGGRWGTSNLQLTAPVRQVAAWGVELGAAAPPPRSPVDCSAPDGCSDTYTATWVPYGSTHLRMSVLPWTAPPPCGNPVSYNGSATATLAGNSNGLAPRGGSGIVANGGDMNLRSGNPGEVNLVLYEATVVDAKHRVAGLSLSYQYVAGYGADGAPGGAVMELLALQAGPCDSAGTVLASLYTSPPLEHFPYDVCPQCYSPPVPVSLTGLALNVSSGLVFALRFTNNQRNVQLKLALPLTITWA